MNASQTKGGSHEDVRTVRRGLYGVFAGGLLGGIASAAILMPSANAAPDQCSASGMATTQSSVSLSMSTYLQTHPETNQAFTDIAKQSPTDGRRVLPDLFRGQPEGGRRFRAIQQPVTELSAQCNTQVSPNAVTDALESI